MISNIMTHSGKYFNFSNPKVEDIDIEDISHALSHICRFGGHSSKFYSVAQHSVLVSYLVDSKYAWEGLLHDCAEAYLGDIPTPLKQLLPDYKKIEKNVENVINQKFNIQSIQQEVKKADLMALWIERNNLFNNKDKWECFDGFDFSSVKLFPFSPLSPNEAKELFISRYNMLLLKKINHKEK